MKFQSKRPGKIVMFPRRLDDTYDVGVVPSVHEQIYGKRSGSVNLAVFDGDLSVLERILSGETHDFVGKTIGDYLQVKGMPLIPGRVKGEEFGYKTKANFEERQRKIQKVTERQVAVFKNRIKDGQIGLYFLKLDAVPYAVKMLQNADFQTNVVNNQTFSPTRITDDLSSSDYEIKIEPSPNTFKSKIKDLQLTYPFQSTYELARYDRNAVAILKAHVRDMESKHYIGDVLLKGSKNALKTFENEKFSLPIGLKYD